MARGGTACRYAGTSKGRLAVQGIAALVQNANFKGFFTGRVYGGASKGICVPGLNCHACPGALGACPIGALQNSLSTASVHFPYYVVGLLLFFGALLGRAVCGFLCPFGLLQDLLYRIPLPKKPVPSRAGHPLRKLKYLVLLVMVVALPLLASAGSAFCKYLCPSGTLAGLFLMLGNNALFQAAGRLFSWKLAVLVAVLILSILAFRPFCKYLCPLGAVYGLLNKVSLLRMRVDQQACVGCGACHAACKMGVDPVADPDHSECIRCGECISACSQGALGYCSAFGNSADAPVRS